jgi:hypothetical protein
MRKEFITLIGLLALSSSAAAVSVQLTAVADYNTGLYPGSYSSQTFNAPSGLAWLLAGRHGTADAGVLPTTTHIDPQDIADAWIDYDQPSLRANSVLKTYARASGYYFNAGLRSGANVDILFDVTVNNPTGFNVRVNLNHHAHGFVASGGASTNANSAVSSASRDGDVHHAHRRSIVHRLRIGIQRYPDRHRRLDRLDGTGERHVV